MSLRAPYGTLPRADADPVELALRPLSSRVIAEMYREDPFWEARFGPYGRRHADNDGDFHASYLAQALHLGSADVMARYARWLRDVLVARGMCSWHLEENFARLRVVVLGSGLPFANAAAGILDAAMSALHRGGIGPAGAVERLLPKLEAVTRARVVGSFLVDALATNEPKHFLAYVAFRRTDAGRHAGTAGGRDDVDAALDAIARVLEAELDAATWPAVRALLAQARS